MTKNTKTTTYALILAGGSGQRMGAQVPKQFLEVGGRSILSHTIEAFYGVDGISRIILLTPSDYMEMARETLTRDIPHITDYDIIEGGVLRNDTIMNGIRHIKENYPYDEHTVVLTHDAVRPFVTDTIIAENIASMADNVACDTVIPATDTIVSSDDGQMISNIPNRADLYQGQTPQTFRMLRFEELYEGLSDEDKKILTDAIKVFVVSGEDVVMVPGDSSNIKITYPFDLLVAEAILSGSKEDV